jgi:tRNA pseudouridine38-40 synthase
MTLTRYKITVSYDGTNYYGWQIQQGLPSIAQTMQDAFFNAFKQRITVAGASRTDAGVHALGQVVRCNLNFSLEPEKLRNAWNNALPADIVIQQIEISPDFSPYHNVQQKTYWYHIFTQRPSIYVQRFGWYVYRPIDMEKLQKSLSLFVGTHDFRSFCTGTDAELKTGTIRTIDEITVEYSPELGAYKIVVKGQKFLHHMIRRIVGAAIEIATRTDLPIEIVHTTLAAKSPAHMLPNAPAKGLMLYSITYVEGNKIK